MILEDLKDKHKGEEMIVVGNGEGLKNIPFAFIESRPNFVLNFFSAWVPFIKPDYWLALDPMCFKGAKYVDDTIKFIKAHNSELFISEYLQHYGEFDNENIILFSMMDRIPGFKYSEKWGLQYSTSAITAMHLAKYMGASKVLLVGIDCTHGVGGYQDIENFMGVSRIPHFYDPRYHFTGYSELWDAQFGLFAEWANGDGMEIVNLSIPTLAQNLERGDYRDYWEPEEAKMPRGRTMEVIV